jgi:beta-mannosidase
MSHATITPTAWRWSGIDLNNTPDPVSTLSLSSGWLPCSQFPTEIHLEHLRANLIPHPYKGRNEHDVQWISERDWLFAADVEVDQAKLNDAKLADLEFQGLDTFVTVWWNGKIILKGDNHFMTYKVSWPGLLVVDTPANSESRHYR